jgi:plastocyanin
MSRRAECVRIASAVVLATIVVAGFAWDASAIARIAVSQRSRLFHPNQLEIARGETVHVENDDGELIHHAYVDAPGFSFDSGEQLPGTTADIHFTKAGVFTVLCRIHPKMALVVKVD